MSSDKEYFVYILRCKDSSLYTGITTDPVRRFEEHRSRGAKGAKYTYAHPVACMEALWKTCGKGAASRLESRIKSLTRACKLELIAGDSSKIADIEGCERLCVPDELKENIQGE